MKRIAVLLTLFGALTWSSPTRAHTWALCTCYMNNQLQAHGWAVIHNPMLAPQATPMEIAQALTVAVSGYNQARLQFNPACPMIMTKFDQAALCSFVFRVD